jgi:hypothetical protein
MTPSRIQRKRTKGSKLPPNTVVVTRPGKWGNPFNLKSAEHCWTAIVHGFKGDKRGRAAASVVMYAAWIKQGKAVEIDCGLTCESKSQTFRAASSPVIKTFVPPTIAEIKAELRGRNLACFCKVGDPCHGDWLFEVANGLEVVK